MPFWNPRRCACRVRYTASFFLDFCVSQAHTFSRIASPKSSFLPLGSAARPEANGYLPGPNPNARQYKLDTLPQQEKHTMRAASQPVSFSLRSLSSAMFVRHARPTRLAVIYFLFTVALVLVPKADILETPFDEANTPTNEIVVEKAVSSWEPRQSETAFRQRIFAQPRRTSIRRISPVYPSRLTDSRTFQELFCTFLC